MQEYTCLSLYNVSTVATAQVSQAERNKIIGSNIKSGVTILGVAGTAVVTTTNTPTGGGSDPGTDYSMRWTGSQVYYVDSNGTKGWSGLVPTTINSNDSLTLDFEAHDNANTYYVLPSSVTVNQDRTGGLSHTGSSGTQSNSGADWNWSASGQTGQLVISNPNSNLHITIQSVEGIRPPAQKTLSIYYMQDSLEEEKIAEFSGSVVESATTWGDLDGEHAYQDTWIENVSGVMNLVIREFNEPDYYPIYVNGESDPVSPNDTIIFDRYESAGVFEKIYWLN